MPKTTSDTPKGLKPYLFHGVEIDYKEGKSQAVGLCPFCLKDGKFYVAVATGLWDCKSCAAKGNPVEFLRLLWESCPTEDLEELAQERGLLDPDTLRLWGVVKSPLLGVFLVPGYGPDGKLHQLYKYAYDHPSGKMRLYPTPDTDNGKFSGHNLHGANLFNPKCQEVHICEGPWDGMTLWETLRHAKHHEDGLAPTSSETHNFLSGACVLATPGANVFLDYWLSMFAKKRVRFYYDNDHPRRNPQNGTLVDGSGYAGTKRATQLLLSSSAAPEEVQFLAWGGEGTTHDAKLPSGYDVRDHLKQATNWRGRVKLVEGLFERLTVVPEEWSAQAKEVIQLGGPKLECLPCDSWSTLVNAWRKAMKWTEGLDRALSVMLASIVSTETLGDQLWIKVMGPPSCGKSTLCEALSVASKYITAKSTIRGFHSGYKSDRDGTEDNSLIPKIKGKTLITKDGDTLLQAPNVSQILAEARDLYDCVSRTHYRHGKDTDYGNVRMTWLLCGTATLRSLDDSELGARFLDCKIMDSIPEELERDVNLRVVNRAFRNVSTISNGTPQSQADPEMTLAKQLTGGYVCHLRENAERLLSAVGVSEQFAHECIALGEFVSFMRARPSKRQDEVAEREFSSRLVEQHARLTACLCAVLNKKHVDKEVMRRVRRVALDTAQGRILEITGHLFDGGRKEGLSMDALCIKTGHPDAQARNDMRFLRKIGVVETFRKQNANGGLGARIKWRLTERLDRLYREVMGFNA